MLKSGTCCAFRPWPRDHISPIHRIMQTNWFRLWTASNNSNISVKSVDSFGPSLKPPWLAAGRNHNETTQQINRNQRDQLVRQSRPPACLQISDADDDQDDQLSACCRTPVECSSSISSQKTAHHLGDACYSVRFSAVRIDSRSFSSPAGPKFLTSSGRCTCKRSLWGPCGSPTVPHLSPPSNVEMKRRLSSI